MPRKINMSKVVPVARGVPANTLDLLQGNAAQPFLVFPFLVWQTIAIQCVRMAFFFLKYLFCFRDIDIFLLCKLDQ